MSDDKYEDSEDLTQVRSIIKQLNEQPAQEKKREVVTRPDGSKVIRVTKRRKRMLTEMDKQKRSRKSFMLGLLAVFLIGCALTGVFFWRMTIVGSEGYLQEKQEELRRIWGASSLSIDGASVSGHVLHVDVLEATFPEDAMIQHVRMSNVEAELDSQSFISNKLRSELVKVASVDVTLRPDVKHLNIPQAQQETFWQFNRVECQNFNVTCGDAASSPVSILNTKAYMYYPRANKTTSVVILNDGTLRIKGWQNVRINDAKITISSNAVEDFIIQGTTNTEENPTEELRTSIAFYGKIMHGEEFAGPHLMDSDNISLADFTDARFDHFFTGRTNVSLRGRAHAKTRILFPFEQAAPVFSGEFELNHVSLTAFPILMHVCEHIEPGKRRSYMPVKMNRAIVKLSHTEGGMQLEIPDNGMIERDLLNVRGTMKVDGENNLSGVMEIALPSILTRVEYPDGISDPLFHEMGEWAWVSAALSGKANRPDDNTADLEARAADARKSRPQRIPFSQIDLDRLMEEMQKTEKPFQEEKLEIGPTPTRNMDDPFGSSDDPFAQ